MRRPTVIAARAVLAGTLCLALAGAALAESTAVFSLKDGRRYGFAARLEQASLTCAAEGEPTRVSIAIPDSAEKIEGDSFTDDPEGARPWRVGGEIQEMLARFRGFEIEIAEDGSAQIWRSGRDNRRTPLLRRPAECPTGSQETCCQPKRFCGSFSRTELRLGPSYMPDDPLSLRDEVVVDLTIDCP